MEGGRGAIEECELWGHNGKNFKIKEGVEVRLSGNVER